MEIDCCWRIFGLQNTNMMISTESLGHPYVVFNFKEKALLECIKYVNVKSTQFGESYVSGTDLGIE